MSHAALFYFNISGKEEKKSIKLIAFPRLGNANSLTMTEKIEVLMLSEQENSLIWESSFINHKKLLCKEISSLYGYGFATMVYVLIY